MPTLFPYTCFCYSLTSSYNTMPPQPAFRADAYEHKFNQLEKSEYSVMQVKPYVQKF